MQVYACMYVCIRPQMMIMMNKVTKEKECKESNSNTLFQMCMWVNKNMHIAMYIFVLATWFTLLQWPPEVQHNTKMSCVASKGTSSPGEIRKQQKRPKKKRQEGK